MTEEVENINGLSNVIKEKNDIMDKNQSTVISFLRVVRSNDYQKFLEYLESGKIEDLNASNANGLTALHLAAKDGFVKICGELLKRGAAVDSVTKKMNTPLHIATLAGQLEILKMLVANGANVNARSSNGFTPLYMAAQENHDACIRYLLSNGADPTLATEDGFTPLAVAMQQGHEGVVALLLEAGDGRGKIKLPALHIAAKKDDVKSASMLLENGNCQPDTVSKSGFTPLHIAAHYGNCAIAKILIQKGADVNYKAKHNITPLHVACKWGKIDILQIFLDNGSKIDAQTEDGLTPLHCAARSGHENVIDILIKHKSSVLSKTRNGLTPLHMASQGDHAASAKMLLEHGAGVDAMTNDFLTPLHVAAHCGHVNIAKILLENGAEPNAAALNGFTPLHIACKKNRIKIVELLLKSNAELSKKTESGLSPLHVASFMGCLNIVMYLLQHEANVNVLSARNETPLHLAVRAGQADIVKILLRNGSKVNEKSTDGQTPLHLAAKFGSSEICKALLDHGANPEEQTEEGYTPLHLAAKEGLKDIVDILIEHKSNVNCKTKKNLTPLHLAVKNGHQKIVKTLLENEAEINSIDENQMSPLISAVHTSHIDIANLLLDKNASPHIQTKNGISALHIASAKNQSDIVQKLLERGANPNVERDDGTVPLQLAAQKGHLKIIKLLINHGAISDHSSKNGLTPLHLCAQEDQVEVAEILIENRAGIENQTKCGFTPLHIAAHYGQIRMVKFLLENNANINVENKDGYTPLHQAAQQGQTLIINVLLAGKANPNKVSKNGYTPLGIARNLGYVTSVDSLKPFTENVLNEDSADKLIVHVPEIGSSNLISDDEDEVDEKEFENHREQYKYLASEPKIYNYLEANGNKEPVDLHTVDNVPIQRPPVHAGFLVSFVVDARGGAMRGCRHSGIHVIVPPKSCNQPTRITCRYVKSQKIQNYPPLMEGEALVSRVLELSPINVKFARPVILEIPHFASLRGNEREIVVLKSENGETWKEHPIQDHDNDDILEAVYHEMFEENEIIQSQHNLARIVISNTFPQYFAIISRVRQEVFQIGPEGSSISSRIVPEIQAVFPANALTKKIRVGLQVQPTGDNNASPIVTVEPRRRKFHKAIVLHIPTPETSDNLRLLCSITGGQNTAIWEDVTGSTPLNFQNNIANFSTTVSARFWLIPGGRNPSEITKIASDMYVRISTVPFLAKFLVYAKKVNSCVKMSVLCVTDEREEKSYENQENYREIARSRNVEVLENSKIFLDAEFLKSNQMSLDFKPFQDNRILFTTQSSEFSNLKFLFDGKVICNLAVALDKINEEETSKTSPTRTESDVALHEPGQELSDEDQTEYDFGQTIENFQFDYVKE